MNQNKVLTARELVALLKLKYSKPSSLLSVGLIEQFLNEYDNCPFTHDQFALMRELVRNGYNYISRYLMYEGTYRYFASKTMDNKPPILFGQELERFDLDGYEFLHYLDHTVLPINIKELLVQYKQLGTLAWEKNIILGDNVNGD